MTPDTWAKKQIQTQLDKYAKTKWLAEEAILLTPDHFLHFNNIEEVKQWCIENFQKRFRIIQEDTEIPPSDKLQVVSGNPKFSKTTKNKSKSSSGSNTVTAPPSLIRQLFNHFLKSGMVFNTIVSNVPFVLEEYMLECESKEDAVLFQLYFSGESIGE